MCIRDREYPGQIRRPRLLSDVSETEKAEADEKNEMNQEQLNGLMQIPTEMPDHVYAAAVKEKLRQRAAPYEAK
eukprot:4672948-Prorocentrum_lima.AAC.1